MEAKRIISNNQLNSQTQSPLLEWYWKHKRNLPFREGKDPYKIWISEIMLQQTRVAAMLNSYLNFIDKLPNIQALASASEEQVVSLWKGLGYYSRAKNLRKGAIYILEKHGGNFPKTLDEILEVPGVGQYTGRAVLSIAFDLPLAVLDGNVKRVLSRIYYFKNNIQLAESHKNLQKLADEFLDQNFPGDHNQAVMELGATICTPSPNCKPCPLISSCLAHKNGMETTVPISRKEQKKLEIEMRFFVLFNSRNQILLIRDTERRFFKSIPSPPYILLGQDIPETYKSKKSILYNELEKLQGPVYYYQKKHSITHHAIRISLVSAGVEVVQHLPENSFFCELSGLEDCFPSSISKKLKSLLESNLLF